MYVLRDDRSTPKTPRWWVAPPTPAEAPEAKRRTAAKSRGSVALVFAAATGFVLAALVLLYRVGRQVGEPRIVPVMATEPVAEPPAAPVSQNLRVITWGANDAGTSALALDGGGPSPPESARVAPSPTPTGPSRRRAPREVFRKPG